MHENNNSTPEVSLEIRKLIIKFAIDQGKTYSETALLTGKSLSTVKRIVKMHKETGNVCSKIRGGRTAGKITEEIKTNLLSLINNNSVYTLTEICEELDLQVHHTTVWRWIKKT